MGESTDFGRRGSLRTYRRNADGVLLLDMQPAIQLTGYVKATFLIPDELYREVKAETAREGRTLREVTIGLFEQWLSEKQRQASSRAIVDWHSFQPPLAHLVSAALDDSGMEAMRESIAHHWHEPT